MQEFGDVAKYREATEQLKKYKSLNAAQIKLEAKKRKELAKEELRLKEIEELRAQTRAQANLKAKRQVFHFKIYWAFSNSLFFSKEDHGFYEQWYKSSAISRGFELWSPFLIWTSGTPIGLILTPRPKNFLSQKTRENRVWNFQIALAGALLKLSKWNFDSRRVWVSSWYRISRKKWFETFHFSDFFKKPTVGGCKMGFGLIKE